MVEGYIVYESFYYSNKYNKKINEREGAVIWDDHQYVEEREGKLLQTNGKRCLIKSKSIIFFQFSRNKLFTLKLIIYISSHAIFLILLYINEFRNFDAINKFVL
jgi:hypothetical protein